MKHGAISSKQLSKPVHGNATSLRARDHLQDIELLKASQKEAKAYNLAAHCVLSASQPHLAEEVARGALSVKDRDDVYSILMEIARYLAKKSEVARKRAEAEAEKGDR